MRTCEPDRNWRLVREAADSDAILNDNFLMDVVAVMSGEKESPNIQTTLEILADDEWRDAVAAFILSGATNEQIARCMWVDIEVIHTFEKLYLDKKSFKHKMEFRRYAEFYAKNRCVDDRMRELLKKGVIEGPESLEDYWMMPGEQLSLTYTEMAKRLASMSYMKAINVRHAGLTEDATKEALKWGSQAFCSSSCWTRI